jgi:hypothetical protein
MESTLRSKQESRPVLEALEPRLLLDGAPLITEFMASNESTLKDDAFPERYTPGVTFH